MVSVEIFTSLDSNTIMEVGKKPPRFHHAKRYTDQ